MASPLSDLIWSVDDLLRGDCKQSDYGQVILPFTLLRRLDCILEPTRTAVLAAAAAKAGEGELVLDRALTKASGQTFCTTSRRTLGTMLADPDQLKQNLIINPPFGVEWKKVQKEVEAEHEKRSYAGRFGPGLPRVSDGSLLFLMHLMSKMQSMQDGASRIGIATCIWIPRYFYRYTPPRSLEEIDRDLRAKTGKIMKLPGEIVG